MREAVTRAFIDREADYRLPDAYGLFDAPDAEGQVRLAIQEYVVAARVAADAAGLSREERLAAFQDGEVATTGERQWYDDFFGWSEGAS